MRIVVVGPGRAAMTLAAASRRVGHDIAGVASRGGRTQEAEALQAEVVNWSDPLPRADLVLLGVRDDAIAEVAISLVPKAAEVGAVVHLSGSVSVEALRPLAEIGVAIGGFHPLQSLPNPDTGAERLPGSWVGVTGDRPETVAMLFKLAESLGTIPFELPDGARPLYHAGASVAANYLVANLALARHLFEGAGVSWKAARPLVEAVVGNVFELGPQEALTGPIARGDSETVRSQLAAIRRDVPEAEHDFIELGKAVARLAGREAEFDEVWE